MYRDPKQWAYVRRLVLETAELAAAAQATDPRQIPCAR
jgi:hypothetical protein